MSHFEAFFRVAIFRYTYYFQIEAHAAQYGYIPQERKSLEQAHEESLASSNDR